MGDILKQNYEDHENKPFFWRVFYNERPDKDFSDYGDMFKYYRSRKKSLKLIGDEDLLTYQLIWKTSEVENEIKRGKTI